MMPSHRRMMMISACATNNSAAEKWNGKKNSFTFIGDDIDPIASGAIRTYGAFVGDFTLIWFPKTIAINQSYFGCYATAEDGTFDQNNSSGAVSTMTDSWWINYNRCIYGGSTKFTFTGDNAVEYKLTRSGGDTFKFYKDGSLEHTFVDTSSMPVRVWMGSSGDWLNMENITWDPCI